MVTYNGQGVAKLGITKAHHAKAFSSKIEPETAAEEKPRKGEKPMLPGIRIKIKKRGDKLD
jgi:hypothetical protein